MYNLHEIFEYEDGLLISKKTGTIYCNLDKDGYIRVRISGKEFRAHRLIWEMFNGPIPEGMLIDHIDRDVFNNRIENLRLVTRQQNNANSSKKLGNCSENGKHLPKGIVMVRGKYRARIWYKGDTFDLGTYSTVHEASSAYLEASFILNGEYALVKH